MDWKARTIEKFTWAEFDDAVTYLADSLRTLRAADSRLFSNIYGVPRGGLVLAVALSHRTRIPLITSRLMITSETLIADDICDSGKTLSGWKNHFIVTLHHVLGATVTPNLYYALRNKDWVVYPWENNR